MSAHLEVVSVKTVAPLDFRSPYDELTELRRFLTTQEIAELTGLRRETISRARPDRRFRRRTEKALADLYAVVTRIRAVGGVDDRQLGAVLRRPQVEFGGRSIADLLRDGEVRVVVGRLANPELAGWSEAPLPPAAMSSGGSGKKAVDAFLAADPELADLLPEIEARIREHFAPVDSIERGVSVEREGEGDDELFLRVKNGLSFDQNFDRLAAFLEDERNLLAPVRTRLTIGFM